MGDAGQGIIARELGQVARQFAQWFPVVAITGPRQSGKTTLIRTAFEDYVYVNLEDVRVRGEAAEDPMGFIENLGSRVVIDEAQHVPELFSAIQVRSDEVGRCGQYVLSGSQNFALLSTIQQSLAGRVGMLQLLPLSYREVTAHRLCQNYQENQAERDGLAQGGIEGQGISADRSAETSRGVLDFIVRGGYPRLASNPIPAKVYFRSYIQTYLERDVAGLLGVRDVVSYRKILQLLAHNAGNLLNYARLSKDAGVSVGTVRSWVQLLEASYLIFTLPPYQANLRARLTKTPKVYFYDTGLLCYLLGISRVEDLIASEYKGAVFENYIIAETQKNYLNQGELASLYFYRDDSKREIDLVDATDPSRVSVAEIKYSTMYHSEYARTIGGVAESLHVEPSDRFVVLRGGSRRIDALGVKVRTAHEWLTNGMNVR